MAAQGFAPLRTTEEEEPVHRAPQLSSVSLAIFALGLLLMGGGMLALGTASRVHARASALAAAQSAAAAPAGAAPAADIDEPVRVTSWQVDGVRFVPAGIDLESRACAPFEKDPNRTTRTNMQQVPLNLASARAIRAREPHGARSRCAVTRCHRANPGFVLRMQDVCLQNDTWHLLSDRDTDPILLADDWWGSPQRPRRYKRFMREVSSEARIGGEHVWLDDTWGLTSPKWRYGHANIFHSICEEIGWLGRFATCAQVGLGPKMRLLMNPHRRLLGQSPTSRLWEIAADGARTYYVDPASVLTTAFCFRRVHVESDLFPPAHEPMVAACARVDALAAAPQPAWPDWPAGNATFRGFRDIVERARARLGYAPLQSRVAQLWDVPRVTVVHRLSNRRLLNLKYVGWVLRDCGFHVTVVSLECMPLEAQLAVVSNSSTLLGVHGAGMTLGHALPSDALVIELRTAPCTEEARGIPYQMRSHNEIIPAPRVAVMPNGTCPPPWKYNRRGYDAVVDIDAVLRAIYLKDPIASQDRTRWPPLPPRPVGLRVM